MSNAMRREIVGAGSKYLAAYEDGEGAWLNSGRDYVLHVPANVPAELFWSVKAYNGKTRAMIYTDQQEINSRMEIKTNADGSTDVYLSSNPDEMPLPQNSLDISAQGDIFVYFRWYAPTKEFFDKTWVLPNIERYVREHGTRDIDRRER